MQRVCFSNGYPCSLQSAIVCNRLNHSCSVRCVCFPVFFLPVAFFCVPFFKSYQVCLHIIFLISTAVAATSGCRHSQLIWPLIEMRMASDGEGRERDGEVARGRRRGERDGEKVARGLAKRRRGGEGDGEGTEEEKRAGGLLNVCAPCVHKIAFHNQWICNCNNQHTQRLRSKCTIISDSLANVLWKHTMQPSTKPSQKRMAETQHNVQMRLRYDLNLPKKPQTHSNVSQTQHELIQMISYYEKWWHRLQQCQFSDSVRIIGGSLKAIGRLKHRKI